VRGAGSVTIPLGGRQGLHPCASFQCTSVHARLWLPLRVVIGDTARIAGGEKTRDGLAYEALNLMPNLLSCLRLDAGRRPRLGPDVQRGLGVAGGLVGAGARVAVVGDAVVDAGLRADDHHRYVNPNMVCLVMYILQQPPGIPQRGVMKLGGGALRVSRLLGPR